MTPPSGPSLDYAELLQAALMGMVRGLLRRAAGEGLPGDHHFYLTFGTREPGVVLGPRLLAQYPEEMTIVLQHQFWNLVVDDDALSVTLRFGGAPERITIPYRALRAFADPSVGFGLRLAPGPESGADAPSAAPGPRAVEAEGKVVDFGSYRRRAEDEGPA